MEWPGDAAIEWDSRVDVVHKGFTQGKSQSVTTAGIEE